MNSRLLKRTLAGVAFLILVGIAVVLVKTARLGSRQPAASPAQKLSLDEGGLANRLAEALRLETISYQDASKIPRGEFRALVELFERSYPRVHAALQRERVSELSLLYTWPGSDPSLRPILLAAHLDVVPVELGTERQWKHSPFAGEIADGYVWGRGALDDKISAVAILEAVERLLSEGHRPRRTILLAFGHDEEVSGAQGAAKIAELLRSRGVRLEYTLDEGSVGMEGGLPLLDVPVALVGTAEKGYLSVELLVRTAGGHSAMPPPQTSVGIVAAAVSAIEQNPMPGRLDGPAGELFAFLSPEMPFGLRVVFANPWLFGPVIRSQLSRAPSSNALLRTTTAPTMLEGSPKENVLPQRATAVVNFRILPGDTVAGVLERVRKVIDDPRVEVRALGNGVEPSPRSSSGARAFVLVARTVREIFPGAVVAPSLVLGSTDSRHYAPISDDVYRFLPVWLTPEDLGRIHGTNERVSVEALAQCVRFYRQLILNSDR